MSLIRRHRKTAPKTNARQEAAGRAEAGPFGRPAADVSEESEVGVCCLCGAPLGFDREDEIDGEGPGRDICGPCNRTRNFDIEAGW